MSQRDNAVAEPSGSARDHDAGEPDAVAPAADDQSAAAARGSGAADDGPAGSGTGPQPVAPRRPRRRMPDDEVTEARDRRDGQQPDSEAGPRDEDGNSDEASLT